LLVGDVCLITKHRCGLYICLSNDRTLSGSWIIESTQEDLILPIFGQIEETHIWSGLWATKLCRGGSDYFYFFSLVALLAPHMFAPFGHADRPLWN